MSTTDPLPSEDEQNENIRLWLDEMVTHGLAVKTVTAEGEDDYVLSQAGYVVFVLMVTLVKDLATSHGIDTYKSETLLEFAARCGGLKAVPSDG